MQALYAMQWPARFAYAYAPAEPDGSHAALAWDEAAGLFTGETILTGKTGLRIGYRIPDLTLFLFDERVSAPQSMRLDGRSFDEIGRWLQQQASAAGLNPNALMVEPPYEIPDHPLAEGAAFSAARNGLQLAEMWAWQCDSMSLLMPLAEDLAGGIPVRLWPRRLDLATWIRVDNGGDGAGIEVGFSPGDEHFPVPYFYVSPQPYPEPSRLAEFDGPGEWNIEGFTAAMLMAPDIVHGPSIGAQQRVAEAFLRAAVDASLAALTDANPVSAS